MRQVVVLIVVVLLVGACAGERAVSLVPATAHEGPAPSSTPALVLTAAPINPAPSSTPDLYTGRIRHRFDVLPSQHRYDAESSVVYAVEPEERLTAELGTINMFPDTKEISLVLLMNYEQAGFQIDSQEYTGAFNFELEPGEEVTFDFTSEPLSEGYYDFALVMIVDLHHNTALDTRSRMRTTFTPVTRRSIFVGDASAPDTSFLPFEEAVEDPGGGFSDALFLTDSPESFNLFSEQQVRAGTTVELFIRLSVPDYIMRDDSMAAPVALVGFLDEEIIPINDQPVIYGSARRGEITTLPVTITAPREPGLYSFFIHRFPNPYTEVLRLGSQDRGFYSLSTQRVVLEVVP